HDTAHSRVVLGETGHWRIELAHHPAAFDAQCHPDDHRLVVPGDPRLDPDRGHPELSRTGCAGATTVVGQYAAGIEAVRAAVMDLRLLSGLLDFRDRALRLSRRSRFARRA